MSDLPPPPPRPPWGTPPPPPPPPPSAVTWGSLPPLPPAPERQAWWLAPLGVAIAALLLAALAIAALRAIGTGPDHPDEWDPRVAPLAAFVEDERGLDFDDPVYVDFLTPEEYRAEATNEADGEPDDQERAEYERDAGELRALGVASGELDLYEAFNSVVDSGTLAFYDPTDQRIRVRGTEMTVGLEVTLVHELTHALQDQRFDLERIYDPDLDSSAATAFRALGEGDALRVENAYVEDELTEDERTEYDDEFAGELAESESATSDVPAFVQAEFGAPYALGEPFVTMLFNEDGNDEVDAAFEDPPHTEEHIFDPASFLAEEDADGVEVEAPEDAEVFETGPFGATSWYLVLAERIDPKVAFAAARGWNGDDSVTYERDGVTCVRAAFAGDTDEDEAEMEDALEEWEAAMPGGEARTLEIDGRPGVEACDPGEDVDMELTGRSDTALYLPNLWGYLIADATTVLDPEDSRCYASRVVDELSFEEITDPEGAAFGDEPFQEVLRAAFEACS